MDLEEQGAGVDELYLPNMGLLIPYFYTNNIGINDAGNEKKKSPESAGQA